MLTKKINLYVVRHGQTFYNIYNKLQGWSNSPLTKQGVLDAKSAAEKLKDIKFVSSYSSDMPRAYETAQIILEELKQNIVNKQLMNFRESFYGSFEGINMDFVWLSAGASVGLKDYFEIAEKYGVDKTKDLLKEVDPWHQAENATEYWQRIDLGFEHLLNDPEIEDGDNVLLVTHGNTLVSLAEKYAKDKIKLTERPKNGSVSKMILSNSGLEIVSFNDQII